MNLLRFSLYFMQFLGLVVCFPSSVIELTEGDFQSTIANVELCLIMFYAPWCRHCKDLKPQFEQAASILNSQGTSTMLARVDCTEAGKQICQEVNIRSYPTLHVYRNGVFSKEYEGPRDAEGIAEHMEGEAIRSPKPIYSKDDLENFINMSGVAVVGFFKEEETSLKNEFNNLAAGLLGKDISFGLYISPDNTKDRIILFRPKHLHNKFEPDSIEYNTDSSITLESFILKQKHGLVGHRKGHNANEFENPLVVGYFNVDYEKNPKGTNYWRNRILKVAQHYSEDFNFAISAENEFPHELAEFGYDYDRNDDKPIIFAKDNSGKKFKMAYEFTVENFERFLNKFKAGKLKPHLKSQPIPNNNKHEVKIAVAENFDELVMKSSKDAFIEFYAPWCVYCKNLEPVLEELGEKMASEDVDIVKIDAVNNDIPSLFDVKGFPTLYWLSKDSKHSPIMYEGGRKLEDFIKYIALHASDELNDYDREGNIRVKDEF